METSITTKNTMHSDFLDRLYSHEESVVVFDGATGTSLQNLNLTEVDFGGINLEGCNENLVLTNPQAVKKVHRDFLEAGCDVIETNSFGGASIVLAEYGLEDQSYKLNKLSAKIAKEIADEYSSEEKKRFVAGSIGPTTKLPTLKHIDLDSLRDSYIIQSLGLIDGNVDLMLIETCQDVLQIKAALQALEIAFKERGKRIPIMVSVTMETTGTMLMGTDIGAVITILEPYPIEILGLNCATGPEQMKEHIKYLSEYSPFTISCIPNAGLPENIGGIAHYRLTPIELKMQLMHFIKDLGVRIIGGCCGTTPDHIKSLVELSNDLTPAKRITRKAKELFNRPKYNYVPSASSLYTSTTYKQDNSFLIIGEKLNASGSKKTREMLDKEDWDGLVGIARNQVKENAHIIDVNVDYVGRDGISDMNNIVSRLVTNINLPIMIDSTDWQKMESGLKVAGGKCLLNSTNYEDGEERFLKVLELAKYYGAGVVIGTIDEEGMARTAIKKFEIASRAYDSCLEFGIPAYEIFYDPLALPISTGIEEDRRNALETIEAINMINKKLKDVHILLGISNVSFGLSPAARITLNSVFLNECCANGMDAAIVSPAKILPLSKISSEHKEICIDLIRDNRRYNDGNCTYDPLAELTNAFDGISTKDARKKLSTLGKLNVEDRLKQHIIDGERVGLEDSLSEALTKYKPLNIINEYLLEGMKVVGDLFGSGQMQLPFVLQSAETMKFSVAYLEPYIEAEQGKISSKGTFLIATVKGDVHDIGKNLVDIILTNNGYEVINLGIKQDVSQIINAQKKYKADCIAMSGLLVKSTAFMKENLQAFNDAGITVPVILGGAALTPKFVNQDCGDTYNGIVIYGKDAFTDLRFMDEYIQSKANSQWDDCKGFLNKRQNTITKINHAQSNKSKDNKSLSKYSENLSIEVNNKRSLRIPEEPAVKPPFIGTKILTSSSIPLDEILYYLDHNALYAGQWQFRKTKEQSRKEYDLFLRDNARPVLDKLIDLVTNDNLIFPSVAYGYFPCGRRGNSLDIFDYECNEKLVEFQFPRQKGGNSYCISDYYRDLKDNKPSDYIPMQAVTVGQRASVYAQDLFKSDSYSEYLYFHGFAVQLAEALAEWCHSRIRKELGFEHLEPDTLNDILAQRYRGSRFSFGYPACPNVSDSRHQLKLLQADRIGLIIDESDQLYPEQSTTALIAIHSSARYFSA